MLPDGRVRVTDRFSVPDRGMPRWCGYTVQDYWIADPPPSGVPLPATYPWVPRTEPTATGDGGPVPSWVARTGTVRYGDSPLYIRKHWRLDGTKRVEICGLENPHSEADLKRAWRGRGLFGEGDAYARQARYAGGRPPGTTKIRPELFRDLAPDLWREFLVNYGHRPTDTEFALQLGMRPRTFSRRLAECRARGMQWPPI